MNMPVWEKLLIFVAIGLALGIAWFGIEYKTTGPRWVNYN